MEIPGSPIRNAASLGLHRPKSTLSEINVTPLVDVFLVLLIIFMVTAPMMQQGIEVSLPEASERPFQPGEEDRFILSVTKDERIFLNDGEIPLEQLEPKLRQLRANRTIRALFLCCSLWWHSRRESAAPAKPWKREQPIV